MYCTVQKWQPVLFHVVLCEFDVAVYCVKVFHEGFYCLGIVLDPGVIHISEPLAQVFSLEEAQSLTSHFFNILVGHNGKNWGAQGPAMLLSV